MNDKINPYMKVQIKNQILEAENFILLLKDAAKKVKSAFGDVISIFKGNDSSGNSQ